MNKQVELDILSQRSIYLKSQIYHDERLIKCLRTVVNEMYGDLEETAKKYRSILADEEAEDEDRK